MQLLDDFVKWFDLFEVLFSANEHEFLLCTSDGDVEALQVFEEHSFVCSLLRARDDDNVTVDTLTLVDGQDLLHAVLAQMRLQEQLLVEERRDYGDLGSFNTTVLKIINDHCTDGSLNKVLVLESLSFLEFEAQDYLVCFEESDRALFDFFKPCEHRVDLSWEDDFLLSDLIASMHHDSVIDDSV